MTDIATLALILGNEVAEKAIVRAAKLRILPVCGRCLGSGHYSHNGTHSRCYGCEGTGQRRPKDAAEWAEVVAAAEACKEDGRLTDYLKACEARAKLRGASKQVLDAWKAADFGSHYDWMRAAAWFREPTHENKRHREISDINKKAADAYKCVEAQHLNSKSPTYDADCLTAALVLDWALATVEAARRELLVYLAKNPA